MSRREAGIVLGALGILIAVAVPELGSDPWPFHNAGRGTGVFGPLVDLADGEFDEAILRAAALLAGVLVAVVGAVTLWLRMLPAWLVGATTAAVVALLALPATFLQVGLRDASEPLMYVNDSTYQIDLAGELVLDGDTPYGHDFRGTGLERWYSTVGADTDIPQVALDHFAYFPGTALTAAVWRLLPNPFDDYRLLVLLCTLALGAAVFLFPAPLHWQLALAAALAANPLAVRAAWFGTADAPSLLLTVLAFAFALRGRVFVVAACLAGAVLLKQFALVAVPFVVVLLLARGLARPVLYRAAAVFGGILLAGFLPFAIADPVALWDDTIAYGAQTYRIIGYGLAGILIETGVLDDRFGSYPFLPLAVLVWLPFTALLLWRQWREREAWLAAAGFASSIFVLLYLGRVFQTSYLIWPLTAVLVASALASERTRTPATDP